MSRIFFPGKRFEFFFNDEILKEDMFSRKMKMKNTRKTYGVYNVKSTKSALADDIACLSSSPVGLHEMLKVAFRYSCLWQFSFNAL